ncbi:MAG: hypothetical protein AVDCRST_MAG20-1662 [uncultured Acidimicrobiales bacterium]|uniref:DnaJ homologue subfamily C member 28 conserved domain-containing protein n=1 Tax=uncultured Acidimicrobiales bacterium TaxID=310071 RepID=A0A6J4I2B3_9ACTN|nr:MAG: hypothetical protein AVDCRST_MAG20-1662 [uncultured Acidimicrobiales bacterium]
MPPVTERKPPGVSWETWIDRQVREAQERGDFDGLPGAGKPLPDLDRRDDDWWLKRMLQREGVTVTPPTIAIRVEVEQALERASQAEDEAAVRAILEAVNEKVRRINRLGAAGPPSTVMPVDIEEVLGRWRSARA